MRLLENGVFNTEALKFSVKRINQLGYFKAIEGKPGKRSKFRRRPAREQGRRQAEARGAEPQSADVRRRRLGVRRGVRAALLPDRELPGPRRKPDMSVQTGSRAQNYSLAFTEPFLFDRNITGGINLFKTDIRYIGQFTQKSSGAVVTLGLPLSGFTRHVHELQLPARAGDRDQRGLPAA